MMTHEENEYLVRTNAGTPMGELFRRYWIPAAMVSELPTPDCPPVRVRLLGENLIAWRNTDGSLGLMQEACPHRGASMFFGRNEENGLRCVYHGWKFDNDGQCVDMPNEPAESNFKHKIKATAYQTRERNGIIWVYMGPRDSTPDLPQLEVGLVPAGSRYVTKKWQDCNWVQSLEGAIDTSHFSFLHMVLTKDAAAARAATASRSSTGTARGRTSSRARWPRNSSAT